MFFNTCRYCSVSFCIPHQLYRQTVFGLPSVFSQRACYPTFSETSRKGLVYEDLAWPSTATQIPVHEHIKKGFRMWPSEIKKWKRELKDNMSHDSVHEVWKKHGDYKVLWRPSSNESLEKWTTSCDSDYNMGTSTCELTLSDAGHLLFSGNINAEFVKPPSIAEHTRTGFAHVRAPLNMRSFSRRQPFDFSGYTHFLVRCRGDGRQYAMVLQIDEEIDVWAFDQYIWMLFTRGGPYWQLSKIPFTKFYLSHKGRIQDDQTMPLVNELNNIKSVGFTLFDTQTGPFRLEIDFIGICRDETHKWQTDYESFYYDHRQHGAMGI